MDHRTSVIVILVVVGKIVRSEKNMCFASVFPLFTAETSIKQCTQMHRDRETKRHGYTERQRDRKIKRQKDTKKGRQRVRENERQSHLVL